MNRLRSAVPILGLFGGAWGGSILPGSLRVGFIWPVCAETVALTGISSDLPAASLVDRTFFTRRDDGAVDSEETVQMIFGGEAR